MTDSEIIKALECCGTTKGYCHDCPLNDIEDIRICQDELVTEAYRLISRQQAEIEKLKAADVEPVKHGHWIDFYGNYETAECSVCEELYEVSDMRESNKMLFEAFSQYYKYCPHCGAKMDGGEGQE